MTTSRLGAPALFAILVLTTPAPAQTGLSQQFLSKQCNEDALRIRLDPRPFHDALAPGFTLALDDGKALVLLLAQDCKEEWLDGQLMGPSQEVHVWLAVEGSGDVRPVVGAQITRPTMTWFSIFDGNTNARVRQARLSGGTAQLPIEAVVLDPPGPERGGRVSITKDLIYTWHVRSSPPRARLVGLNHDFYVKDPGGKVVLNRIQALADLAAADSPGILKVTGSTAALPLLGVGDYDVSVNSLFPVWIRGAFGNPVTSTGTLTDPVKLTTGHRSICQ